MKPDAPTRAYVGLGANLGDVMTTLAEVLWALDALPQTTVRQQSDFFRTPAWGRTDQPDFVNAAVELQTRMPARVLLDALLAIEQRFGRVRDPQDRWGPRSVDLDLLLYGDQQLNEPGLTVPHPRLHERAFVLVPLAQIAPMLEVPGQGAVGELLAAVDVSGIEAIP
jgi:2-amino-4-hydroxy-6-hydroxymethyldihydropteridine diphosphokinase